MSSLSNDALLLYIDSPLRYEKEAWEKVCRGMEHRLGIRGWTIVEGSPQLGTKESWENAWEEWREAGVERITLVSVGESTPIRDLAMASLAWEAGVSCDGDQEWQPQIYIAPEWDARDWSEFLLSASPDSLSMEWRLVTSPPPSWDPIGEEGDLVRNHAYRARRLAVVEIVWELRRQGAIADFEFASSSSLGEDREFAQRSLTKAPARLPTVVWIPWTEGSLVGQRRDAFSPEKTGVSSPWPGRLARSCEGSSGRDARATNKSHTSVVLIGDGLSRRQVPIRKAFPLDRIASLLVSKSLLATRHGERLAPTHTGDGYRRLVRQMNEVLPNDYRAQEHDVNPRSMGSAKLQSDQFGEVPWGEIWTSFCELAIAGGPPHRGTWLATVSSEEVDKDREGYERVVAEIERGVQLAARLEPVRSKDLGWVGVRCESEEMAGWMVLAMVAENVTARREGTILYVPAGPGFTIKREIKNVITSVSKTAYYWRQRDE